MTYDTFRDNRGYICDALATYGGGFCQGLAVALSRADGSNTRRIYETWPELWADYGPGGRFFQRHGR